MVGRRKSRRIITFIIVLMGAVLMLYPLAWMVSSSFKPELLIFADRSLIIREFTLENYIRGLGGVGGITFFQFFLNSMTIVVPVVIGNVLSCSLVAFAIARLEFPWKKAVFATVLLTMMLPMHVTLIPRFVMFLELGWVGTYLPLTVPNFFAVAGFFCFLLIQFMRGIPKDLDEAAIVDGCGPLGIYAKIIMPLSVPALITAAIFSFIWTYDDFFSQLIYIRRPSMFTVALALRMYNEQMELSAIGVLMAMSTVALLPVIIFFTTCQRFLIEGISTTGLKG